MAGAAHLRNAHQAIYKIRVAHPNGKQEQKPYSLLMLLSNQTASSDIRSHLAPSARAITLMTLAIPPVRLGLSGGNSGKFPEYSPEPLSELFLHFPLRVRRGPPKPNNSRHLKYSEHEDFSPPLGTAGAQLFFQRSVSVATPADRRSEQTFYVVQVWGGDTFLGKCR